MGCLNSNKNFEHKFGNIHLSGPCNRTCFFCIGQYMMGQDANISLDDWPLKGLSEFVTKCNEQGITEVNITGTNTDPSLYKHTEKLLTHLRKHIPGVTIGVRTNGVILSDWMDGYDKGSFSITSTNPDVYNRTMGGLPPCPNEMFDHTSGRPWKINIVLTPKSLSTLPETINDLFFAGFRTINIREPYGQPNVGDPLKDEHAAVRLWNKDIHGMPTYHFNGATVTYWDVHYVEVESVNLYADGRVSTDYPVSRGHADDGVVLPQSEFTVFGRKVKQWVR